MTGTYAARATEVCLLDFQTEGTLPSGKSPTTFEFRRGIMSDRELPCPQAGCLLFSSFFGGFLGRFPLKLPTFGGLLGKLS